MDGIARLVPLLNASLPLALRAVTAMTLTNLGAQEESALQIADVGGVNALIQCMGKPTDDVLLEKAASALWNLSAVNSIKATIRKAGCIPFLLSVFEFSKFVPAIENCLGTLLSLAETQENRFAIAEAGAIGLLIRQVESPHPAVQEKAAGVIWNLAHEESVQHTVRQLGGLKPLIDLLGSENPLIRFNVAGAFPLLTEQEDNVKECFELGAIPPLIGILAQDSNVLVLQNAAQSVGNVAEGHLEYQNAIREAQGLERLVDVMAAWTPNTPTPQNNTTEDPGAEVDWANRQALLAKCSYAVWLICDKNEVSQSNYRDAGGMEKLTALLSPTNDDTLLEMAAGAICALCEGCDANKVAFRESKGIEPLIDLLDHRSETA